MKQNRLKRLPEIKVRLYLRMPYNANPSQTESEDAHEQAVTATLKHSLQGLPLMETEADFGPTLGSTRAHRERATGSRSAALPAMNTQT